MHNTIVHLLLPDTQSVTQQGGGQGQLRMLIRCPVRLLTFVLALQREAPSNFSESYQALPKALGPQLQKVLKYQKEKQRLLCKLMPVLAASGSCTLGAVLGSLSDA